MIMMIMTMTAMMTMMFETMMMMLLLKMANMMTIGIIIRRNRYISRISIISSSRSRINSRKLNVRICSRINRSHSCGSGSGICNGSCSGRGSCIGSGSGSGGGSGGGSGSGRRSISGNSGDGRRIRINLILNSINNVNSMVFLSLAVPLFFSCSYSYAYSFYYYSHDYD